VGAPRSYDPRWQPVGTHRGWEIRRSPQGYYGAHDGRRAFGHRFRTEGGLRGAIDERIARAERRAGRQTPRRGLLRRSAGGLFGAAAAALGARRRNRATAEAARERGARLAPKAGPRRAERPPKPPPGPATRKAARLKAPRISTSAGNLMSRLLGGGVTPEELRRLMASGQLRVRGR
jgi:hypothetical protein